MGLEGRRVADRSCPPSMPAFLEQGARELSSFCLAWVDGGDTKAGGGPCWSHALLWPTWENRVHPGPWAWAEGGARLQAGLGLRPCQLPEKSLSLNGLLGVFPEASMDWPFYQETPLFPKGRVQKGSRRREDVGRGEWVRGPGRGTGRDGDQQGQMTGNLSLNPLKTIPGGVYHCPHFTEKETEAGRGRPTCPRLQVTKSTFKLRTM